MIYILVWMHFLSDFILQTDKMAMNKSKSNEWLAIHVSIYSLPFLIFGWKYAFLNWMAHFATDWLSSRATTYLWKKNERHWFFAVIGLDQAVHMSCLIVTMPYMVEWWK